MEPYVGEIALFAFNRIPQGWLPCNGQLLNIQQNPALYSLLGPRYGGDGKNTFALPDLRGQVVVQCTASTPLASRGGQESVTLALSNIPAHTHTMKASTLDANNNNPNGRILAKSNIDLYSAPSTPLQALNTGSVGISGGGQAHENRQPSLAVQFCIATSGIYPQRS